MTDAGKILLTSAGSKIPLLKALEESLKRVAPDSTVIATDSDRDSPASAIAQEFIPESEFAGLTEERLIQNLLDRGVRLVFPTRDGELLTWSRRKESFRASGIGIVCSSEPPLATALDKLEFYRWGVGLGFPMIHTSSALEEIESERIVVKERLGAGSRGVLLDVSREVASERKRYLVSPVFQPYVEGREFSVDCYLTQESKLHGMVCRWRNRVKNGESEVTTTFRNKAAEEEIGRILESSGLVGPAVLQAIDGPDGIHVIELNPRFGGASSASIAVGLDSLAWAVSEAFDPDRPLPKFERLGQEIRNIRYSTDLHVAWS